MARSTDQDLHGDRDRGLVPIPDPTLLTTAQLDRAISNLDARLTTRLDGMDKAAELLHADFTRVPTEVDRQISHLRDLLMGEISKLRAETAEVFKRIEVQFIERDKRTEQLALASSTAIAAALQAAKEAVGAQNTSNSIAIAKSEQSTAESLRQLQALFTNDSRATNAKVDDLKSRLDKGEGGTIQTKEVRRDSRDNMGLIVAIAAAAIALGALFLKSNGLQ